MKKLLIIYLVCITSDKCFSQAIKSINYIDTLRLENVFIKDSVTIKINSTTIFVPYNEFDRFLQILKRKVFNVSYLRRRQSDIKKALFIVHKQKKENQRIYIDDSLQTLIGQQFISSHLAEMIENNKAIIIKNDNTRQLLIIRERASRHRGVLNGWGGRYYYIIGDKNEFLTVTDWVS